jgi:hypothetical protein
MWTTDWHWQGACLKLPGTRLPLHWFCPRITWFTHGGSRCYRTMCFNVLHFGLFSDRTWWLLPASRRGDISSLISREFQLYTNSYCYFCELPSVNPPGRESTDQERLYPPRHAHQIDKSSEKKSLHFVPNPCLRPALGKNTVSFRPPWCDLTLWETISSLWVCWLGIALEFIQAVVSWGNFPFPHRMTYMYM